MTAVKVVEEKIQSSQWDDLPEGWHETSIETPETVLAVNQFGRLYRIAITLVLVLDNYPSSDHVQWGGYDRSNCSCGSTA